MFQQLPHEIISEILKEVVVATGDSAYLTPSLVCRWFRDVVRNDIFRKAAHFAWLDSKIFFPLFNAHFLDWNLWYETFKLESKHLYLFCVLSLHLKVLSTGRSSLRSTVKSLDRCTASGNAWSFLSPIHQGIGEEEDEGNCWASTQKTVAQDFAPRTVFLLQEMNLC